MAQDTQKLRELLQQYIGDVYAEALQYTNDPAAAKEVTRRVMTLLKRSQEAGLAVNPSMARRLTQDCCREREYYENRRATFVNGTIADMPDFDTALSEISPAEVQARARSEAETKAAEAHAAIRAAEAMGAKVITSKPAPSPGASIHSNPEVIDLNEFDDEDDELDYDDDYGDEYDDEYDEEETPDEEKPRREKPRAGKKPASGFSIFLLAIMVLLLLFLLICLVVMLMKCGIIPGADSHFVRSFAIWFNSHLFPLF
ncbi:MAG: hypothetical protein SPL16_04520 [Eubacteriales bacterium]|nr:hypothetical protein [Clostridiales bacterium]MDY5709974.1 hypothetical protein [Eubacteriales bacterium]